MAGTGLRGRVADKSLSLARQVPKARTRLAASPGDYADRPPVLLITVPKSGTHLVRQICGAMPGVEDWGGFLVRHAPPLRYFSERGPGRSPATLARKVKRIVPGELFTSHLQFQAPVAEAAKAQNAFIILLVRDPRAIVVSFAHYVAETPWHALHSKFVVMSERERLLAAINGVQGGDGSVPDIGRMLGGFVPWADEASATLRYEDLRNDPEVAVAGLVEKYRRHATADWEIEPAVRAALDAIDPTASHTFREGKVDGWKRALDGEMVRSINALAHDFMVEFDYDL